MAYLTQFGSASGIPLAQGGSVPSEYTLAEVLLVGGGGPNVPSYTTIYAVNGGGGGAVLQSSAYLFKQGVAYTITIGGAATDSSIIGGNVKLIATGCGPEGSRTLVLDPYTTSYGASPGNGYFYYGKGGNGAGGTEGTPIIITTPYAECASGGNGIVSSISGTNTAYGGGGGGASILPSFNPGFGGKGGGGTGSSPSTNASTGGTANTGGGAGGTGPSAGLILGGGSGVCIIRYPTAYRAAPTVTSNAPTPAQTGYNVYRWNSGPGTITF